jgi:hypothetical protein
MTGGLRTRLVVAGVLILVMSTIASSSAPMAVGQVTPAWGVVDSTCADDRNTANRAVGISIAVVEAHWDRYLPAPGKVDGAYVTALRGRIERCLDAGLRVVLGSGVQYPPSWVNELPGGRFRDQRGRSPSTREVNIVFAAAVRNAEADYLRRLATDLPIERIDGIRVGTSAAGEIGYPGPNASGDGFLQSWWAFDDAAQTGRGLPRGQTASPMPGWIPGQPTWQGQPVTAAQAMNWFIWYERALAQTVVFQAETLRVAGYAGAVHLPAPGRGVLPSDLTAATAARLDGTADRDGALGRGLFYVDQFPLLAQSAPAPLVVDLTSVDDASAVRARALHPRQDMCAPGDAAASLNDTTLVRQWSNLRFARAQAARADMAVVGENPGPPAPETGGGRGSDSEREQLRRSPGYARSCALVALLFAFERDLHTTRSGVSLSDLASAISSG